MTSMTTVFLCSNDLRIPFLVGNPIEENYLRVSEKHEIYYATFGNPKGIPVVIFHGGPGAGCHPQLAKFFDPNIWYVIMFDQRGAMRSKPFACMEENTTQNLIQDTELLRKHLGVKKWVCFGGSWGSLLAVAYGQAHPDSCLGFILRGVFLGRQQDCLYLLKGARNCKSEEYQEFLSLFSEKERRDLLNSCYRKIMDPDPLVHMAVAKSYLKYVATHMSPNPNPALVQKYLEDDRLALSMERSFFHYAVHQFFLKENQIFSHMNRLNHLPAILVHGQKDWICPLEQARLLQKMWNHSRLWILQDNGHFPETPDMVSALIKAALLLAQLNENRLQPV